MKFSHLVIFKEFNHNDGYKVLIFAKKTHEKAEKLTGSKNPVSSPHTNYRMFFSRLIISRDGFAHLRSAENRYKVYDQHLLHIFYVLKTVYI